MAYFHRNARYALKVSQEGRAIGTLRMTLARSRTVPPCWGLYFGDDLRVSRRRSNLLGSEHKKHSCPLWVKSRHMRCNRPCPLYTQ